MPSRPQSTIIVGAGVFGASTAYHLRKAEPEAKVTLIDRTLFTSPYAASNDINKVVRADYGEPFYCGLALEALEEWRNGPLYKPYFYQSGLMNVENTGLGRKIIQNFENMGVKHESVIISPEKAKSMFGGNFRNGEWKDVEEVYWNPSSGWAAATEACTRVTQAAIDDGAEYVEGTVDVLTFGPDGQCTGLKLEDGRTLSADRVVLCTGANTAKLLADSAPERKELHAGDRIVAAGVVIADVDLTEAQVEQLRGIPVFIGGMEYTEGETMPATSQKKMKLCRDVSFSHVAFHEPTGTHFSIPPKDLKHNTWSQEVPQGLKDEIHNVLIKNHGEGADEVFKINSYRMCWDAVTPDQGFIISPHSHCRSLYVATAGSFHGWKFLPILGNFVVQMLNGTLDETRAKKWAWDRPKSDSAHAGLLPSRDLADIAGWQEIIGQGGGHLDGAEAGAESIEARL